MGWRLAIDFGTSNTAAAVQAPDGSIHPLPLTHRSHLMPSSVFMSRDSVYVGEAALNHAPANPLAFAVAPKRQIGQEHVSLDGRDVPVPEVISPVIAECLARGRAHMGGSSPDVVVLTHPEAWSRFALANLGAAAELAGIPREFLAVLSEPRAAVRFYSADTALAAGSRIAVFDFGGGTLDVAVMEIGDEGEARMLAARGDNTLGGRTIDTIIHRWVREQLEEENPEIADALEEADHLTLNRVEDSIRDAKELLSSNPDATITVDTPAGRETLLLTRSELEDLCRDDLLRGVDVVRSALLDANCPADGSVTCYLTGGSSRIPLVHELLAPVVSVATLDDPKTVVARGALTAPRSGPVRAPATGASAGIAPQAAPTSGSADVAPPRAAGEWMQSELVARMTSQAKTIGTRVSSAVGSDLEKSREFLSSLAARRSRTPSGPGSAGETPPSTGAGETPPSTGAGETPPSTGVGEAPPSTGVGEAPPSTGVGVPPAPGSANESPASANAWSAWPVVNYAPGGLGAPAVRDAAAAPADGKHISGAGEVDAASARRWRRATLLTLVASVVVGVLFMIESQLIMYSDWGSIVPLAVYWVVSIVCLVRQKHSRQSTWKMLVLIGVVLLLMYGGVTISSIV